MTVEKGSNMNHQQQPFEVSIDTAGSKCFDDDGRLKRTGNSFISYILSLSLSKHVVKVLVNLAQLVGIVHNICKVRRQTSATTKKNMGVKR